MIVRLYGDSLSLPRIGVIRPSERYITILLNYLIKKNNSSYIELIDRSFAGNDIKKISGLFVHDNSYFGNKGDILIIHCGIVDCAPRPIPQGLRNIISKLPVIIKKHIINFLHINRFRILNSGFSWTVIGSIDFESEYFQILKKAIGNYKRIYCIGIAPTNLKIEQHSPGFSLNVVKFNNIIKNVIQEISDPSIHFVDIHSIICMDYYNLDNYIMHEDGHHITPKTHMIIADEIIKIEDMFE